MTVIKLVAVDCVVHTCMYVSIFGGGTTFEDKFVYVNIVCVDVSCFCLIFKCMCLGLAHLRKGTSRPHYYYYYLYLELRASFLLMIW